MTSLRRRRRLELAACLRQNTPSPTQAIYLPEKAMKSFFVRNEVSQTREQQKVRQGSEKKS